MNYLTSHKTLNDAFVTIAKEVLINGKPQQAYITNAHLGMASRRHIHSLEPFRQGDYVEFGEGVYLVMEDVVNVRGAKYKSTIQYCNYNVATPDKQGERYQDGVDDRGLPIWKYEKIPGRKIYVIIDMDRITITGSQIRVNTATMIMLLPDSEENRDEIKVNNEIDVYGKTMKVAAINRLRTGLQEVTLEVKP